ncbi:MAG: hypothetical protein ABI743_04450 [bacterium]
MTPLPDNTNLSQRLETARAWYDGPYGQWVTGNIGAVVSPTVARSITGAAGEGDTGDSLQDALGLGCVALLNPFNWPTPDVLWDAAQAHWGHPVNCGCGGLLILLTLPCWIIYGLIMVVIMATGAKTSFDRTPKPTTHALPDPLLDFLISQGMVVRAADPTEWVAIAQNSSLLRGVSLRAWTTPIAYVMQSPDGSRQWIQVGLREDVGDNNRTAYWTFAICPPSPAPPPLAPPPQGGGGEPEGMRSEMGPNGVRLIAIRHEPVQVAYSPAPIARREMEVLVEDWGVNVGTA